MTALQVSPEERVMRRRFRHHHDGPRIILLPAREPFSRFLFPFQPVTVLSSAGSSIPGCCPPLLKDRLAGKKRVTRERFQQ
ncbi:MAG: hypothetical protein ACFFD4_12555 [Candidatus Odinarchaeota archaeon]